MEILATRLDLLDRLVFGSVLHEASPSFRTPRAWPFGKIVLTYIPMLPLGESFPPTMENPRLFCPGPFSNFTAWMEYWVDAWCGFLGKVENREPSSVLVSGLWKRKLGCNDLCIQRRHFYKSNRSVVWSKSDLRKVYWFQNSSFELWIELKSNHLRAWLLLNQYDHRC